MKPPVARKPKHLQGEKLESDMKSPSTESLPPQVTGRAVIIKELIDTERTFLSDLLVIQEVFTLQGQSPISRSDHRILFGNLDSVIDISDTLYRGWDGHECIRADFDYNSIAVGRIFVQHMKEIEQVYSKYCKNQTESLQKIQEYSQPDGPTEIKEFLLKAQKELQGKTEAWDLASMLVKPVQRVLKYPLLIKRLLKDTDSTHFDFDMLQKASEEIDLVADTINQVKKRKDTVQKYVQQRQNTNVIHGLTKKLNRSAQKIKNVISTSDDELDKTETTLSDYCEQFNAFYDKIHLLEASLWTWIESLRGNISLTELAQHDAKFLSAAQSLNELSSDTRKGLLRKYLDVNMQAHVTEAINDAVAYIDKAHQIRKKIIPIIGVSLNQFVSPKIVLKKRLDKELDYDRYRGLIARNEKVDDLLKTSVEVYESLYAELLDGLPVFLQLCQDLIFIILDEFMGIQMAFYAKLARVLASTLDDVGLDHDFSPNAILADFQNNMRIGAIAERSCAAIKVIRPWRDSIWKSSHYSLSPAADLIELSSPVKSRASGIIMLCKFEFTAEFDDELTILPGDEILILNDQERAGSDEWWYGESKRGKGWFPRAFVQ